VNKIGFNLIFDIPRPPFRKRSGRLS